MKVAIYGRAIAQKEIKHFEHLLDVINSNSIEAIIYEGFNDFLSQKRNIKTALNTFTLHENLHTKVDVLLSIGGDGTILDSVSFIKDSGIPIVGINFGRMGFLAATSNDDIENAIKALLNKSYTVVERELVEVCCDKALFGTENFGLNEFTLQRKNTSSMINIDVFINNEHLNTYWADGLIVATPTGSTGYSLSCGGPIVYPNSQSFIITPVAPHNLNVRPMVVPNDVELRFEVSGRGNRFLATLDTRVQNIDNTYKISLKKAPFTIKLIRLDNKTFINALRTKLLWGLDKRN
jgi:NAD+ kinase